MAATEAMTSWLGALAQSGVLDEAGEAGEAVAAFVVGEARLAELNAWFRAQSFERAKAERRAAIELCIWMAHADREIDPEERHLLRQIVLASGLDDDSQDALVAAVHKPPPIDGVEERLTHPVLRELMLALAWELAMVDGRIHDEERALFTTLADRLGIDAERAEAIRASVSEEIA
jgi:tellurite resistance protein